MSFAYTSQGISGLKKCISVLKGQAAFPKGLREWTGNQGERSAV